MDNDLKKIKQITIELHDFLYDSDLRPQIKNIITRLKRLGFLYINFTAPVDNTDTLFINKACLSPVQLFDLLVFKHLRLKIRNVVKKYKTLNRSQLPPAEPVA